jgi:hypothetical protein
MSKVIRNYKAFSLGLCVYASWVGFSGNHGDARHRVDLHPLRVKRVLHVGADDLHVRADWRQLHFVRITLERGNRRAQRPNSRPARAPGIKSTT